MNETKNKGTRDPITGEQGSHPVATGDGAAACGVGGTAAGAAAGAAAGTAGAGPIGTAVGAVAGAIIGGAAGHKTAEATEGSRTSTRSEQDGRYIGYSVIDKNNEKIGAVESVWLDGSGDPAYLSVRSGWLGMGRTHVVPAQRAEANDQ